MNTERPDHDEAPENPAAATDAGSAGETADSPEAKGPEGPRPGPTGGSHDGGDGHGGGGHRGHGGGGGGDAGPGDSTGRGRAGRGRLPVVVASVAAGVLLVGGGTAYLVAGTSGGSGDRTGPEAPGGHGTPPPLVLDGYAIGATGGPARGIAPGEPGPYGATYRADGTLPDGPGRAPVYTAPGHVTRDEVARLAKALGVFGAPVAGAHAWRVGSGRDGAGPMLLVDSQAPGLWTFNRYAPGTDDCRGKGEPCTLDPRFLMTPDAPAVVPSPPSGQPDPRPSGPATAAPVTHDVHVQGYTARGYELTVTFEGGVCADYRASAQEAPDRVTVTVTATSWPGRVCIQIAKEYRRTLHLARPLGDRKVVGPDGSEIPQARPGVRSAPVTPRRSGQPVT